LKSNAKTKSDFDAARPAPHDHKPHAVRPGSQHLIDPRFNSRQKS
jgi:hypothetical protein